MLGSRGNGEVVGRRREGCRSVGVRVLVGGDVRDYGGEGSRRSRGLGLLFGCRCGEAGEECVLQVEVEVVKMGSG